MRCYTDGSVLPIGVDTSGGGRAALATVEGQSCLRWVVEDGSQYLFSAETGTLLSYTTTDRQVISNASSYLDVRHAGDGSLRQIWNLWDGLLNVENVTSTGYTIALYTPGQITGTDGQGFYTVTGAPLKHLFFPWMLRKSSPSRNRRLPGSPMPSPGGTTAWRGTCGRARGKTPSRPSARARSWNRKTRSGSWSRKSPKRNRGGAHLRHLPDHGRGRPAAHAGGRLRKPGGANHAIRLRPVRAAQDGNGPGRQPDS